MHNVDDIDNFNNIEPFSIDNTGKNDEPDAIWDTKDPKIRRLMQQIEEGEMNDFVELEGLPGGQEPESPEKNFGFKKNKAAPGRHSANLPDPTSNMESEEVELTPQQLKQLYDLYINGELPDDFDWNC